MIISLNIKKCYYFQILNGIKTIEYRSIKPFYKNLKKPIKKIIFITYLSINWKDQRKIIVNVNEIKIIKKPKFLNKSKIKFTKNVYAIYFKL